MRSVVAKDMTDPAITAALSQQEDNEEFRKRPLDETQTDLGMTENVLQMKKSLHGIRQRQMFQSDQAGFTMRKKIIKVHSFETSKTSI